MASDPATKETDQDNKIFSAPVISLLKGGGVFDHVTDQAVHAFQQSELKLTKNMGGFSVDGVVGPITWAALGYVVPRA